MKNWFKLFTVSFLFIQSILVGVLILVSEDSNDLSPISPPKAVSPSPAPKIILKSLPLNKTLINDYHVFQTFNNCGPAALSMTLSYYDINESQQVLGFALRPFQNPQGDNDDKSVTLDELAEKSKEYGFTPYHRPLGNPELIKLFITYDIPVIARTWLKANDDVGHYRVIKGYDDLRKVFIQDDSLQGKNLEYSYEEFDAIWRKFNYEYLVLIPNEKREIAKEILGKNLDYKEAWANAADFAKKELIKNSNDKDVRFNLSVALYNIGKYEEAIEEFEKIENELSFRTLWYQIEPIKAYYELGNYGKVFELTDRVLNPFNRAFSELYILRGKIYLSQENKGMARKEFEKAVFYNQTLTEAKTAMNLL